ncbi:MAG: hypothetical protein JRH13_12050 [Deltaproteobacteria bacterium]|nr:hypothetical protein [Deltaproteobacteria bacterium]MBW2018328.1 hypothetical protein [Deltaproteobacteria bacterium]MBW2130084.1 hypothetical protein [Deltaproteobacteria bacterium]MBW2304151.1 hypothetical protein [Deltaproteobacteria bacterium]
MSKRQAQFRFEDTFYSDISNLAGTEGVTVSEVVRNALKFYMAVYERTKGKKSKLYLEYDEPGKEKCELVLPWMI